MTHQDFWRIYDVCLNHTWLESALLKHNGHSMFFPSFIWLTDLRFFHGNQQLVFYVGLTLLLIATGLLLIPLWRDESVTFTAKIMFALVIIVGPLWIGDEDLLTSDGLNFNAALLFSAMDR